MDRPANEARFLMRTEFLELAGCYLLIAVPFKSPAMRSKSGHRGLSNF
jgi:hypothetical protein